MKPSIASRNTRKTERRPVNDAWCDTREALSAQAVFLAEEITHLAGGASVGPFSSPACSRPSLIILLILLLAGFSTALLARRGQLHPAGINLLVGSSASKLNSTCAGGIEVARPSVPDQDVANPSAHVSEASMPLAPSPLAILQVTEPGSVPFVPPAGTALSVPVLPLPEPMTTVTSLPELPLPAAASEAIADETFSLRIPHRGDSPMMHNWRLLGWHMVLATALTAAPVPTALVAQEPKSQAEPDATTAILKRLDDVKKFLEEMDKRLKGTLESLTSTDVNVAKLQMDTNDIKRQLGQLRSDVDALRSRTSLYLPAPAPAAVPPTGRVRLVNTFPDLMTIIVNERAYRLPPGDTRLTDPLPAGTFTYMVLGVQPEQTRTLAANETFTITIHPR